MFTEMMALGSGGGGGIKEVVYLYEKISTASTNGFKYSVINESGISLINSKDTASGSFITFYEDDYVKIEYTINTMKFTAKQNIIVDYAPDSAISGSTETVVNLSAGQDHTIQSSTPYYRHAPITVTVK